MEVSDKLAAEFNTIIISHTLALLILFSFSAYIYFRAKKTPLLYSYLLVVGMIALWMISKIHKTVSPLIELRWFFIITQYFAIDFLGLCLFIFAYIYKNNKLPAKKQLLLWLLFPAVSFGIVVTNPLHMSFYSYFDIYKDRFGFMFYIAQCVHYLYLIIGTVMLSKGFTKQPVFSGKRNFGKLFAVIVLLPLFANIYYIMFKLGVFRWIFPFSVFDFSPIAASISLILFMIPALKFRFFDMSPVSISRLYDIVPQGIVFLDKNHNLYGGNQTFFSMLNIEKNPVTLDSLVKYSNKVSDGNAEQLTEFINDETRHTEITLNDGRCIKISKSSIKNGILLCLNDITEINQNRYILSEQNTELERINVLLDKMAEDAKELAVARTKAQMAQNVHDILGHSLTVVIGTAELAAGDDAEHALQKANQIEELLTGSLNDIRNAFGGNGMKWGETTLIKAINHLKNDNINLEITVHGNVYELNASQTEAVYRLCQESITNAIKHGKAKNIYIILRYRYDKFEIYAVDNGKGCKTILKNYGLNGIEKRFTELSGSVDFTSDGESGFTIHAELPKQAHG